MHGMVIIGPPDTTWLHTRRLILVSAVSVKLREGKEGQGGKGGSAVQECQLLCLGGLKNCYIRGVGECDTLVRCCFS